MLPIRRGIRTRQRVGSKWNVANSELGQRLVLSELVSLHLNFLESLLKYKLASPRWPRSYRNAHLIDFHYQKDSAHCVSQSSKILSALFIKSIYSRDQFDTQTIDSNNTCVD